MPYSESQLRAIFEKGRAIRGKSERWYRRDRLGNEIFWFSYGKRGQKSWEVDHILPKARGGSDALSNLQPLQWEANREKGAKRR